VQEIRTATGHLTASADSFDSITARSGQLAQERAEAERALQAQAQAAQRARQAAISAGAENFLASEFRQAENRYNQALNARTGTIPEIRAATGHFTAAAEAFNGLTSRSTVLSREANEAGRNLNAAIALAARAQTTARNAGAETFLASEFQAVLNRHNQGLNAPRNSPQEMHSVTALLNDVTAVYGDLTSRSHALTRERNEALRVLNAAVTLAERAQTAARNAGAETFLPSEFQAAVNRHNTGLNAPRNSPQEMQSAAEHLQAAASLYNDIAGRSQQARANEQNQALAIAARERAEAGRQRALDARAPVAAPDEFVGAQAIFASAGSSFSGNNFTQAVSQYNASAAAFIQAAALSENRRLLAGNAIQGARDRSALSGAFAVSTGQTIESEAN
jgi:hypothetical protein